ncbi:MAG: hypothetical protein HXY22_00135 [Alphaproteobacteria bacterium]|nr:hypothetical protein [Alphaproteobacteria bacterium]
MRGKLGCMGKAQAAMTLYRLLIEVARGTISPSIPGSERRYSSGTQRLAVNDLMGAWIRQPLAPYGGSSLNTERF